MTKFEELPEGCIATILSMTTPLDAGRLSLVSKTFCSAADSDIVWNQFLDSDPHLISSIISQCPSLANAPTKKALYLALSDRPIIIDHGRKSFQFERNSGKKCYMLSARSLTIVWGDDTNYWKWTTKIDSRFPEVACLHFVFWFEIRGKINKLALSKNTRYAAYLVFEMARSVGFKNTPVELSVGVEGCFQNTKKGYLHPDVEYKMYCRELRRAHNNVRCLHNGLVGLSFPSGRSDGWLEIEMGEFFNSGLENEEINMSVMEINCGNIKRRFFLAGIEIRPKGGN